MTLEGLGFAMRRAEGRDVVTLLICGVAGHRDTRAPFPEFRGCNSQSYNHWLDSFMLTPP